MAIFNSFLYVYQMVIPIYIYIHISHINPYKSPFSIAMLVYRRVRFEMLTRYFIKSPKPEVTEVMNQPFGGHFTYSN